MRIGKVEAQVAAGEAVKETPEEFVIRRDREISEWLGAKRTLESAKPIELDAREKVTTTLFPTPKKGTNRYHLNGGYSIKLVHGTNYTLGDKDKVEGEGEEARKVPVAEQVRDMLFKVYEHLTASGKTADEANAFLGQIVVWKPELHEKTYLTLDTTNNVDAVTKSIIDEILTTKPATPQLTFETPKDKK
jgi:hypothetical protein